MLSLPTRSLRLLLAAVLALCLPIRCLSWTWDHKDMVYGPCVWFQFAEKCQQPVACASLNAPLRTPLPTDGQASPIDFAQISVTNERDPVNSAKAIASATCMQRIFPQIVHVDPVTNTEDADSEVVMTEASMMRLEVDGGGAIVARCRPSDPFFVNIDFCGPAPKNEHGPMPIPFAGIYEILSFHFHNGLLHSWGYGEAEDFPLSTDLEVEVYLRKSKHAAHSTEQNPSYLPQCFDSMKERLQPDLIVSLFLQPSSTVNEVNVSVLTRLVDAIGFSADALSRGSGSIVELPNTFTFFPFESVVVKGAREQDRINAFAGTPVNPLVFYSGSEISAPCAQNIPRIVFTQPLLVPSTVSTLLFSASPLNKDGVSGMPFDLLPSTVVYSSVMFQLPHDVPGDKDDDDAGGDDDKGNSGPSAALFVLIAVNALLASYLVLLVMARREWITWPTFLGGLNHPVQFYIVAGGLDAARPEHRKAGAGNGTDGVRSSSRGHRIGQEEGSDSGTDASASATEDSSGDIGFDPVLKTQHAATVMTDTLPPASSKADEGQKAAVEGAPVHDNESWEQGLQQETSWASRSHQRRRSSAKAFPSLPTSPRMALSDVSDQEDDKNDRSIEPIVRRRK